MIPTFTDSDVLTMVAGLLPRGRAWAKQSTSNMMQTLAALVPTVTVLLNRGANLLVDEFPSTTVELLPEWEETLGLPDPCQGEAPTIPERRAQVVARFVGVGGQSLEYLTQFAANLGYTVTFTEFNDFRMGVSAMGDPLNDEQWPYALQVNAPAQTIEYFMMGENAMGDPLETWGNTVLECEFKRITAGQVTLIFAYG